VPRRSYWPIALIVLAAAVGVVVALLPASIVTRFLPPALRAEDFSGSIWHGSAGKITLGGRDAGAVEWRLHPASLLALSVAADVHWVKVGFVIDAAVELNRHGFAAHDLKGGGPIQDLQDFGVAAGWRGTADVGFSDIEADFAKPRAAFGEIRVSNVTSAQLAQGVDLGSYDLRFAQGAVDADGNVTANLNDMGGPLDLQAVIRYSARDRTGLLSGTVRERTGAPAALVSQINDIAQLRGRDAQGRVPVDLELTL
jgi:hypothetical protein